MIIRCLSQFGLMLAAAIAMPAHAAQTSYPGVHVQEAGKPKPIEGIKAATPLSQAPNDASRMRPAGRASIVGPGMEANTNRVGSDYRSFDSATPEQCKQECAKDGRCKAWTWVIPGVQGPGARCWLKEAVPAATPNQSCCVSGLSARAPGGSASVPGGPPNALLPGTQAPWPAGKAKGLPTPERSASAPPKARLAAPIRIRNASAERRTMGIQGDNALAAATYRALLTAEGAESLVEAGIIKPEIITINKQRPAGFVFRPGAAIAIHGRGFASSGQLRLLGSFKVRPAFAVNDWRPSVIYARLADDISGEEDLDDVRLELVPEGRQAIVVTSVRFEATREVTLLKEIPQRHVTLPGHQASYGTGGARPASEIADSNYEFVRSVSAQSAIVNRYNLGRGAPWFAPGTDVYSLPLRPGFEIEAVTFWHGRTETNPSRCGRDAGGTYFQGQYRAAIEGSNVVRIDWGVGRCHHSPELGFGGYDRNYSAYGVDIHVVGPRGVSPWR